MAVLFYFGLFYTLCCFVRSLVCNQKIGKERFGAVFMPCANVIADHGNTAGSQTDRDRNRNLKEFHYNAEYRQRNLRIFRLTENGVQSTVFHTGILNSRH